MPTLSCDPVSCPTDLPQFCGWVLVWHDLARHDLPFFLPLCAIGAVHMLCLILSAWSLTLHSTQVLLLCSTPLMLELSSASQLTWVTLVSFAQSSMDEHKLLT